MKADPAVSELQVSVFRIPTDLPEADGTLSWDETTVVLVEASGAGHTGLGYTYADAACQTLIAGKLADIVCGRPILDVPGTWEMMVRACRNLGRPGLTSCAISAVDNALWDLKARLLDLPLSRLLGAVRRDVPIYGSGGFTTYDEATTIAQLERWTDTWAIPRVKIKVGESWGSEPGRDLSRIALARKVIGPEAELFVDANGGYTRKQAIRMADAMDAFGVSWFEEPVSSDDLAGLRHIRGRVQADVAAGEYGYDLVYFQRMVAAGAVDCLQADITRCGGVTEWLRVAAVAAANGLEISGHCAPSLHVPVAAAVPNLRHVEYFHDHVRIEQMLFDGTTDPTGGVLSVDADRPGFGLELKHTDAERLRVG